MARIMEGEKDDTHVCLGRPTTRWLEIALIFLVFFVHGGASAPHVNETCYLTKAKHYWDPAWCGGDLFLESADAHLVFYWTVGWLAAFFRYPRWLGSAALRRGGCWPGRGND